MTAYLKLKMTATKLNFVDLYSCPKWIRGAPVVCNQRLITQESGPKK